MTVTNESGGRLNAFANEPEIELMGSVPRKYNPAQLFQLIALIALITIIGVYFLFK